MVPAQSFTSYQHYVLCPVKLNQLFYIQPTHILWTLWINHTIFNLKSACQVFYLMLELFKYRGTHCLWARLIRWNYGWNPWLRMFELHTKIQCKFGVTCNNLTKQPECCLILIQWHTIKNKYELQWIAIWKFEYHVPFLH